MQMSNTIYLLKKQIIQKALRLICLDCSVTENPIKPLRWSYLRKQLTCYLSILEYVYGEASTKIRFLPGLFCSKSHLRSSPKPNLGGFIRVSFSGGAVWGVNDTLSKTRQNYELCQKRETWYVRTHSNVVSENIPCRTKALLKVR